MKKLVLILVLAVLGLNACKKDTPVIVSAFDKVSYADIKAKEGTGDLTTASIVAQDGNAVYKLNNGAIIVYKTNVGAYGKLLIVDNGSGNAAHALIFNMVNFKADGSVLFEKKNAQVELGNFFDLDQGVQYLNDSNQSFSYSSLADKSKSIYPELATAMYLYAN